MPKNQHAQRIFFSFNPTMTYGWSKSAEIVLSKSNFYVKNRRFFFKKSFLPKNQHAQRSTSLSKSAKIVLSKSNFYVKNRLRRSFFVKKTFFSNFNFWTTLFYKIMPNFWRTGAPPILKIQWFPLSILIFGQNSCFLGPTIFKIPQPNWYLYT